MKLHIYLDERPIDRGIVAVDDRPADVPTSFNPRFGTQSNEFDEKRGYIYLDRKFNPNLSLRSIFRVTTSKEERPLAVQAEELEVDDRTLPVSPNASDQYYETYTLQNDLIGKFNTGAIAHTLLLGIELIRQTGVFYNNASAGVIGTIDIFNPVFDFSIPPLEPKPESNSSAEANTFAVYIQDQIALSNNLKLVLGGRFDSFNYEKSFYNDPTAEDNVSEAEEFSPRVGIIYQPIEPVSLYANYKGAIESN